MASRPVSARKEPERPRKRATTPIGRENQIAAAVYDLAEEQVLAGTASSQVMTYFLKAASTREKLEQKRIEMEIELLRSKKEQMASMARSEELMKEAITAFRSYSGADPTEFVDHFDD